MAFYELIVGEGPRTAEVVRETRKRSTLGVGEIAARLKTGEPVLIVSTTDYPLDLDIEEGRRRQHAALLTAHAAISQLGHAVTVRYRAAEESDPEVVSIEVAQNLMEGEILYLRQEHD